MGPPGVPGVPGEKKIYHIPKKYVKMSLSYPSSQKRCSKNADFMLQIIETGH